MHPQLATAGVYTLPSNPDVLPPSQTGQAWERRQGRPRKSTVDVMAAGPSTFGKHSTDRSFEISADGARQKVTAEARAVIRPLPRPAQRRRTEGVTEGDGLSGTLEVDSSFGPDTDTGRDDDEAEGSDNDWDYVEDTVRPEERLDPNGDPVDSEDEQDGTSEKVGKRKAYASSVCLIFFKISVMLNANRTIPWLCS